MTPTPQHTLRDYQEVAKQFIRSRKRAGLFLDMGLGKTAITLHALDADRLPVLVTAPKRVAEETWPVEAAKFRPDLTIAVAAGSPAKRQKALNSGADIIVVSRDNLADAVPHADKFKTFVMDELSSFKTRSTNRWKHAKAITKASNLQHVWGLTGTPSPNGLLDLWAQMYLLDGGATLGRTLGGFRERYFTAGHQLPSGIVTEWNLNPGAEQRILKLIEPTCLAMGTEGRVELPPVTYNRVELPMAPKIRELYDDFRKSLVLGLEVLGEENRTASNAAVLGGKLRQLSAGFSYVDDADLREQEYTMLDYSRINWIKEMADVATSPVLVFYNFQAELKELKKALGKEAHTMDEPGIVAQWNAGKVPLLLAHPASAGHGLNLQHGGHTLVWSSLTWNLEEYQQANKRLARSGQKHPVVIHHLVAPGTIDEAVLSALESKGAVQRQLLEYLESPI